MSTLIAPDEAPASPSKAAAPIEPVAVPPPLPRTTRAKAAEPRPAPSADRPTLAPVEITPRAAQPAPEPRVDLGRLS